MKLKLQLFISAILLIICNSIHAQINYTQDFETASHGWSTTTDFALSTTDPCTGVSSFEGSALNWADVFVFDATTVSPSLGASSGMPATLSFNYKLLDGLGSVSNISDWGSIIVQYSINASGPWTTIETINSANHTESAVCALHTSPVFSPPTAGNFYLRYVVAAPNNGDIAELYLILDDVALTQAAAPACTGTLPSSVTQTSNIAVCSTATFQLSLSPAYALTGLNFQWQSSSDNITYTNLTGSANSGFINVTQAATTWYRAIISCSGGGTPVTSTPVQVVSTGLPCYCEIVFPEGAEAITRVKISSLDNITDPESDSELEDFTGTIPATQLAIGATYPVILEGNTESTDEDIYTDHFTVFFDFNRDGDFDDTNESFYAGSITGSDGEDGMQVISSITVPAAATPGLVVMRVVKLYNFEPTDACDVDEDFDYGQAEDYLMNLVAPVACNGAPAVATILAGEGTVCLNSSTQLVVATAYDTSGITFQWQSSADNTTYADILTATGGTYTATPAQNTWYRVIVKCANGDLTTPSTPIQITTTLCYCEPEFSTGVEAISYVSFATMTNTSDYEDEDNQYEDFTTTVTAPVVQQGQIYTISVGGNTYGDDDFISVYFDWDHNGEFDEVTEVKQVGLLVSEDEDGEQVSAQVTIPANAALGSTRMRVIKRYDVYGIACNESGWGQAEDYFVTVTAAAGLQAFNTADFKFYPNPVKDVLNLYYTQVISNVEVYNLVGQRVLNETFDANEGVIDMGSLAIGTYIVKVFSGNAVKAVKVIKQ